MVEIIPVDDHDLVLFILKSLGQVYTGKTCTYDDNSGIIRFRDVDWHGFLRSEGDNEEVFEFRI